MGVMLVGALAVAARADVYTWTDSDGVAHFTNMKPQGGKWKKVLSSEPDQGSKASAKRGACERCDKVPAKDNSPERFHRYDQYIVEASQLYRIPVALIRAPKMSPGTPPLRQSCQTTRKLVPDQAAEGANPVEQI